MKKNKLMKFCLGILVIIVLTVTIFIIISKKNDNTVTIIKDNSLQVHDEDQKNIINNDIIEEDDKIDTPAISDVNTNDDNSPSDNLDIIAKDKNKVSITIKAGTLTVDGAVIVITDTNVSPYSWTPIYKLQQKIDGVWKDVELKNPENAFFPNIEQDNTTGVMEQSLVWSNKYGQVGIGEYRIVKETSRNRVLC